MFLYLKPYKSRGTNSVVASGAGPTMAFESQESPLHFVTVTAALQAENVACKGRLYCELYDYI